MYMKFQKLLMAECRDMDKKHQKCPKNGGFPPFATPQDFFSKKKFFDLHITLARVHPVQISSHLDY